MRTETDTPIKCAICPSAGGLERKHVSDEGDLVDATRARAGLGMLDVWRTTAFRKRQTLIDFGLHRLHSIYSTRTTDETPDLDRRRPTHPVQPFEAEIRSPLQRRS